MKIQSNKTPTAKPVQPASSTHTQVESKGAQLRKYTHFSIYSPIWASLCMIGHLLSGRFFTRRKEVQKAFQEAAKNIPDLTDGIEFIRTAPTSKIEAALTYVTEKGSITNSDIKYIRDHSKKQIIQLIEFTKKHKNDLTDKIYNALSQNPSLIKQLHKCTQIELKQLLQYEPKKIEKALKLSSEYGRDPGAVALYLAGLDKVEVPSADRLLEGVNTGIFGARVLFQASGYVPDKTADTLTDGIKGNAFTSHGVFVKLDKFDNPVHLKWIKTSINEDDTTPKEITYKALQIDGPILETIYVGEGITQKHIMTDDTIDKLLKMIGELA